MTSRPNIYWLASYPKSGNTWTRAFIANLTHETAEAVDINALHTGAIASGREWVEAALDFDIDELSHDEIDALRPTAYRWLSERLDAPGHHKIHDAYTFLPNGMPLIPVEATKGALCIVRNPLDVAISFANHNSSSIDQSIGHIADSTYSFCAKSGRLFNQLRQQLLSWSEHVTSWVGAPDIHKHLVRYEDMQQSPMETFTQIATFLELPNDKQAISTALAHCKMENLQAQEALSPFREKAANTDTFFRKGIVGDWQQTLTAAQINQVIDDHREVMARFGYLNEHGQPSTLISLKTPTA